MGAPILKVFWFQQLKPDPEESMYRNSILKFQFTEQKIEIPNCTGTTRDSCLISLAASLSWGAGFSAFLDFLLPGTSLPDSDNQPRAGEGSNCC